MGTPLLWIGALLWLGLFGIALLLTVFVTVYYLTNHHWDLMACYLLAAVNITLLAAAFLAATVALRQ